MVEDGPLLLQPEVPEPFDMPVRSHFSWISCSVSRFLGL